MQRFTISADDDLSAAFDDWLRRHGYTNRSEAFRDLVRRELAADQPTQKGRCVAIVSYAYDHEARQLSQRLTRQQHDHTSLVISTMHVHVDSARCAEAVVMRGDSGDVHRVAEALIAETGIEHGAVNFIPLSEGDAPHAPRHESHHED